MHAGRAGRVDRVHKAGNVQGGQGEVLRFAPRGRLGQKRLHLGAQIGTGQQRNHTNQPRHAQVGPVGPGEGAGGKRLGLGCEVGEGLGQIMDAVVGHIGFGLTAGLGHRGSHSLHQGFVNGA